MFVFTLLYYAGFQLTTGQTSKTNETSPRIHRAERKQQFVSYGVPIGYNPYDNVYVDYKHFSRPHESHYNYVPVTLEDDAKYPSFDPGFVYPSSTQSAYPVEYYPTFNFTTEFYPEVIDAKSNFLPHSSVFQSINRNVTKLKFNVNSGQRRPTSNYDNEKPISVEVVHMACDKAGALSAILNIKSAINSIPVFEDSISNSAECAVAREASTRGGLRLRLNVSSGSYRACGVRQCSQGYLCVRLRFPTIDDLRMAGDTALVLQCRTQEPIVAHTKYVQFPVSDGVVGRAAESVTVSGGASNAVDCRLEILRRETAGSYRALAAGSNVLLGEELLVRMAVVENSVWHYSRLSEVTLSSGARTVSLLSPAGCVLPPMRALCPLDPVRDTPLVHTFVLRAPMFQGGDGENIKLSVGVLACVYGESCSASCDAPTTRNKRSEAAQGRSADPAAMADSVASVSLKVVADQHQLGITPAISMFQVTMLTTLASFCLIAFVVILKYSQYNNVGARSGLINNL